MRFASRNQRKADELGAILGVDICLVDIETVEIQSLDIHEVIETKARSAFQSTGEPTLVEDTSLGFNAWNGLPGPLIRWFIDSVGVDGLCRQLDTWADRTAIAVTAMAICTGVDTFVATGELRGCITNKPRGTNGFGWDSIFQPDGTDRTLAELTASEKNAMSMRAIAAQRLSGTMTSLQIR